MMSAARAGGPETTKRAAFLLTDALWCYRTGQFQRLLEVVSHVYPEAGAVNLSPAIVFAAMAHASLGDLETAKLELGRARELIAPNWPEGVERPGTWHPWLFAHLLLKEAEELINPSAVSKPAAR
jgi:hypothetical protein